MSLAGGALRSPACNLWGFSLAMTIISERVVDLRKSIDESAKHANTTFLAFYGLWVFFVGTIANISDGQLLVGMTILVPAFQVTMPLFLFIYLVPATVLVVHLYMLVQLAHLIHLYLDLHQELGALGSKRERDRQRVLLFPFVLTLSVLAPRSRSGVGTAASIVSTVTVLILPLIGFILCQVRFVALHDKHVTFAHQIVVLADCLFACGFSAWLLWKTAPINADDNARSVSRSRMWSGIYDIYLLLILVATVYVSCWEAVVPKFTISSPDINWIDRNLPWRRSLSIPKGFNVSTAVEPGREVNLEGRDLRGGTFMDVDFSNANMKGVQLQGSWLRGSRFVDADLTNAHFQGAYAGFARFDGADLYGANFTGAYLPGTDFVGAKVFSAEFFTAMLDDADFSFAQVGSEFVGAALDRAKFTGAQMLRANFTQASLYGAILSGAGLAFQGIPPHEKDAEVPTRFVPPGPDRYAVSFRDADLTAAQFGQVDFAYADFSDFDICTADMKPVAADKWEALRAQVIKRLPEGATLRAALLRLDYARNRQMAQFPAELAQAGRRTCMVSTPGVFSNWIKTAPDYVTGVCTDPYAKNGFLAGLRDSTNERPLSVSRKNNVTKVLAAIEAGTCAALQSSKDELEADLK